MMNPVSPVCLLHHRFAGQGSPPASLCAGALAFSVPRLSTFLMTEELVSQGFANPGGGPRCMHAQCMATFKCVSIQSCPELLICSARCPERTSNVAAAFLLRPAVQPPPFSCSLQYNQSKAAIDVEAEVAAEEEEVYFSDDEQEAAYQVRIRRVERTAFLRVRLA